MFQICLCGAQPSYPHAADCPYPMYFDSPAQVEKWEKAREALRELSLGWISTLWSEYNPITRTCEGETKIYGKETPIKILEKADNKQQRYLVATIEEKPCYGWLWAEAIRPRPE